MKNKSGTLKKILATVGKSRSFIALSFVLTALNVALTLAIPLFVADVVNAAVGAGKVELEAVYRALVKIGASALLSAVAQWAVGCINNKIVCTVVHGIRGTAFRKLHRLPLSYLDSHKTGDTLSRIISDTENFADGLLMGFTQLFSGVLTIVGTLVFMFAVNVWIALIVVVITPLSLVVSRFIASRTYSMFKKRAESMGALTSYSEEIIGGIRVVQAFSQEDEAMARFDRLNGEAERNTLMAVFFSSLTNPCTRFVNSTVYFGVCLGGALMAVSGMMTVGALTCFLSYANQYTKPFNEISGVIAELQNSIACAERVFELTDQPDETDGEGLLPEVRGDISFDSVSFSYSPDKPLIGDFCLDVPQGSRVAIVGPTGCGKTTLINLLMRFYDVNSGRITVDSTDINSVKKRSLRENFGMVLQDTWIFSGTVADNIALGRAGIKRSDIEAAARLSGADSFISKMKDGYDTVLDEDGGMMSAGEKQLLCITRVMLAPPPMLILDEATSSIDTVLEIRIRRAFDRLMQGRTSFVVAHRLSTIKNCDTILVMKAGHIEEIGSHDELICADGFYKQLYMAGSTD